jgi:hypothetical protein
MSIVHPASGRGYYDWYRLTNCIHVQGESASIENIWKPCFRQHPQIVPEAFPMEAGDDTCSIRKTVALPC